MKSLYLIFSVVLAITVLQVRGEESQPIIKFKDDGTAEPARSESLLRLTPIAGLSAVNLKGNVDGWDSDAGVSIGGLAAFGSGAFSVETGLLYNNYQMTRNVDSYYYHLQLDYLSVPLLARVNFFGDPNSTVYLKAGLMPSFLISKSYSGGYFFYTNTYGDVTADTFDLPAVVTLGGAIPVNRRHSKAVIVELTYLRSLTNSIGTETGRARNEGVLLMSGFSFSL